MLRPICKAVIEVRHQAEIPGAIYQAYRIARSGEPGPVGVVIPFPFFNAAWDYDHPVPPPYPLPVRRAGLSPGARPAVGPPQAGRDLRRDGLRRRRARRWPRSPRCSRRPSQPRSAARGASPTRTRWPSAGATASRGRAPPRRSSRTWTSCWPSGSATARSRRPTTPIPTRSRSSTSTPTRTTSAATSTPASSSAPTRALFFDRLLADAAAIRAPRLPAALEEDPRAPRGRPRARTPGCGSPAASTRCSS